MSINLYPVIIKVNEKDFEVTFSGIPEASFKADYFDPKGLFSENYFKKHASLHFIELIEKGVFNNRHIPQTFRPLEPGEVYVDIGLNKALKIFLNNIRIEQGWSKSDLARKLEIERQTIRQYLMMSHPTKAETLSKMVSLLGYHVGIVCTKIDP